MGFLTNVETCYKQNGPRVGCFVGFCHHCLATTKVHTHANRYPLLQYGMKKFCEQSLLAEQKLQHYVNAKVNTKVDNALNDK